jgi:hypothetical protein
MQQLDWIFHARAIQCEREKKHWELSKTDHDTAIIKPPLEQYYDPRMDHPCSSVLNSFYRKNEKKHEVDFY